MEISQLLTAPGAAPPPKGLKDEAGHGDRFAQLYQQAAHSADSSAEAIAGQDSLALLSGEIRPGAAASLEKLLGELETGTEEGIVEALAGTLQNPAELTPLARRISVFLGGDAPARTDALPGHAPGHQSEASPLAGAGAQGATLASIRQRLDLIANAQQGDAPGQPVQLAGLKAASTETGASPHKPLADTLADSPALSGSANGEALRHQALTAQGQANALSREGVQANATRPSDTFIEAVATVNGDDAKLPGRTGSEHIAHQGMPSTAPGTAGPTTPNGTAQPQGISQPTLNAPLASAQWQQGLGQQLVAMHQRGDRRVELHLHPAELGPVSISLKLDDQLAQAQFASANPQVRAAIEQALPQLREALGENGIQLGEAMVGEHHQREGEQPAERDGTLSANASMSPGTSGEQEPLAGPSQGIDPSGRVNLYA